MLAFVGRRCRWQRENGINKWRRSEHECVPHNYIVRKQLPDMWTRKWYHNYLLIDWSQSWTWCCCANAQCIGRVRCVLCAPRIWATSQCWSALVAWSGSSLFLEENAIESIEPAGLSLISADDGLNETRGIDFSRGRAGFCLVLLFNILCLF